MNALYCYLGGSLVFVVGTVHTGAPVEYLIGSLLFTAGSIAAIAERFSK